MKWEPIETAPKDRYVLLCLGGRDVGIGRWNRNLHSYHSHIGGWVNDDGTENTSFFLSPTHWMDLPELPIVEPAGNTPAPASEPMNPPCLEGEVWEWHEGTSESGDVDFWTSSLGRVFQEMPDRIRLVGP